MPPDTPSPIRPVTLEKDMTSDRYTICPDCGMHMAPGEADEHMRGHVAQQRGGEDRFELMTNADGTIVRVPRY